MVVASGISQRLVKSLMKGANERGEKFFIETLNVRRTNAAMFLFATFSLRQRKSRFKKHKITNYQQTKNYSALLTTHY